MTLKEKYQALLEFVEAYAEPERIWEEDGKLKIRALVDRPVQRAVLEEKIEAMGPPAPADLSVYVRVREASGSPVHLIEKGRPPLQEIDVKRAAVPANPGVEG